MDEYVALCHMLFSCVFFVHLFYCVSVCRNLYTYLWMHVFIKNLNQSHMTFTCLEVTFHKFTASSVFVGVQYNHVFLQLKCACLKYKHDSLIIKQKVNYNLNINTSNNINQKHGKHGATKTWHTLVAYCIYYRKLI
jgi:hypothetical protein